MPFHDLMPAAHRFPAALPLSNGYMHVAMLPEWVQTLVVLSAAVSVMIRHLNIF